MICWHRSRTLKRHRRNFSLLLHGTNNTHNMNWPENTPTYSPFSKLKTQAFNVFVAANSLIIHICPRARLAFLGHVAETRQTQSVINELNLFGNWKMSTCPRGTSCQVSSFIYSHKMQRKTDDCYPKKRRKESGNPKVNCSSVDQNIGCFCSLPSSCPPLFLSLFKLILDVCRFCCLRCCLVFTLVLSSMHLPIPFQKRHQENGGWREKQQSLEKKKRRRVVSASHFDPYVSLTPEFFSPKVRRVEELSRSRWNAWKSWRRRWRNLQSENICVFHLFYSLTSSSSPLLRFLGSLLLPGRLWEKSNLVRSTTVVAET